MRSVPGHRYLERVGDAVRKRDDGRYELDDPVLGLWLRWRRPGGTVVPMTVIGDAAERDVATLLAPMGFDLVYQSGAVAVVDARAPFARCAVPRGSASSFASAA
jgi:hypothetical protein